MQTTTFNPTPMESGVTSDYSLFVFLGKNRPVADHVSDVQTSISLIGQKSPVLVSRLPDGQLRVDDGQHRVVALRNLGLPIHYVVSPKALTISEIRDINNSQKSWKLSDYTHSFAASGNSSYKVLNNLRNLSEEHLGKPLSIGATVYLIKGYSASVNGLKEGDLSISESEQRKFLKQLKLVAELAEVQDGLFRSVFTAAKGISALKVLMDFPNYDHKSFVSRVKSTKRGQLTTINKLSDGVFMLESVYNKNRSPREKIQLVRFYEDMLLEKKLSKDSE